MKKWGRLKIKNHLKVKGINDKLMNRCMDEIDETDYENAVKKIWDKYYLEHSKGLKEYQIRNKTVKYLISRGFEYSLIQDIAN